MVTTRSATRYDTSGHKKTSTPLGRIRKINPSRFFFEWKGHPVEDLAQFLAITQAERPDKPIVYLAGDSSLDNKFWLHQTPEDLDLEVPAIYEKTFAKPRPKADVAFWMNHLLGERATCINTAVEESMLRDRDEKLLSHDEFIRDNIRSEDVLVVSVGANDVALKPLPWTVWHMLRLAWLTRRKSLDDCNAGSLSYFKHMFGNKVQDYITRLTAKTKPRAVIVCMIYFPLEAKFEQKSWAEMQLKALGYNSYPSQLQAAIRAMFEIATTKIQIAGTEVVPCALHEVLDGKTPGDYTARVEPNHEGGRKMAIKFMELLGDMLETPIESSSTIPQ
ncbi:hypothetical protein EK21DRAFT_67257 [Setomelanomma holmii]|uniref:Uncharacterized protein n=1 Tax=Setomelanomma holmii TaxID=210430 RepID=A0A9P4H9R1_9PLEO|nr:hypothetical protein EK21DRAFT_67257 [Setomelanomma holmii]